MAAYSLPSSKATRVKTRQSLSLGPRVRRKGDLSGYHQPCYDESHSLNAAYAQIFRVLIPHNVLKPILQTGPREASGPAISFYRSPERVVLYCTGGQTGSPFLGRDPS